MLIGPASSRLNICEHPGGDGNPPKTLMLATRIADERQHRDRERCSWPTCSSAPTTMMPLIALVTDISGVCRAWCTLPIT